MFKKTEKKYEVVRGAVSYELANFIFNYLMMQRDATAHLYKHGIIKDTALNQLFGTWKDPQMPNTFSKYGDWGIETLLMKLLPLMCKTTGLSLLPCYGYGRIYKNEMNLFDTRIEGVVKYPTLLILEAILGKFLLIPQVRRVLKNILVTVR